MSALSAAGRDELLSIGRMPALRRGLPDFGLKMNRDLHSAAANIPCAVPVPFEGSHLREDLRGDGPRGVGARHGLKGPAPSGPAEACRRRKAEPQRADCWPPA